MDDTEIDEIINALGIIYDWIDYTPEYFLDKHGWKDDEKEINRVIEKLKKQKD